MNNWKTFFGFSFCAALVAASLLRGAETAAPIPEPLTQKFPLQQIVLLDSPDAVNEPVPVSTDFVVATGKLKGIDVAELTPRLMSGKGRAIDRDLLVAITQVVGVFLRQHDFPVADITVPDQNIRTGTLRLIVYLGKLHEIHTKGNHWFSQATLQDRLGVGQGDTIKLSQLDRAVAWANNTNPFRQLKLHLDPLPNTKGEYDLIIGVEEELPLRLVAGYDNTGNDLLGVDRYTAAVTYGNVWGLEHQATYQFTTGNDIKIFQAHSLTYQAPLRWQHVIQASAAYVKVAPTFLEGFFKQKGESKVADAKYIIPWKLTHWQGEISGSLGFRESDNNLEFSGTPVLGATTDTFLAAVGAAAVRDDSHGKWIASLTLTGSPGTLNSRSEEKVYAESRIGANPRFAHLQATLQRSTKLTPDCVSNLRATVQLASTNLLPSEQFSVGGMGTVRGYKERIISGDNGYIFSHELQHRLPSVPLGGNRPKIDLAGVAFWEYGRTIFKSPLPTELKSQHLASAGIGLRAQYSKYASASIDVARQLEEVETPGEPHHRVHVKVTLSY